MKENVILDGWRSEGEKGKRQSAVKLTITTVYPEKSQDTQKVLENCTGLTAN